MRISAQRPAPTFESVWALIQEFNHYLSEKPKETDFDRKIGRMQKYCNDNPDFYVEHYFLTAFEYGKKTYFGEEFDDIDNYLKGLKTKDIYNLVLFNKKTIAIIELKYTVKELDYSRTHEKLIPEVLKKPQAFRANFPDYQNHKIYLGLATNVFYPELEQECINKGIAIIKQVGDTVVINDGHLKVF